jgi:hypothetical protein
MQVDTASVLRILAHELRSPAGVAQGYIRMALDGRLPDAANQREALEHAREAVGRIGALSREASDVASWLERSSAPTFPWLTLDGHTLLNETLNRIGREQLDASLPELPAAMPVRTRDAAALTGALVSLARATLRESPGTRLSFGVQLSHADTTDATGDGTSPARHLDIAVAAAPMLPSLLRGPSAADAAPLSLERGGLGLSLVMAALVLDAHGATMWTQYGHRAALAVRLPLETGRAS